MTKREQILAAIRTRLTGTASVGNRIWRTRVEPVPREESPAIIVEPVKDSPALETYVSTLDWTLDVRVTVVTRGPVPDQLADPIIESLHARLMADTTLGGLAIDILPTGVNFLFAEADGAAGEIQCGYRVMYRTPLANLAG